MSKHTASLAVALLLLLLLVSFGEAARPMPADLKNAQPEVVEEASLDDNSVDEECGGVGEEECLTRRTLTAHTDYIYKRGNKA